MRENSEVFSEWEVSGKSKGKCIQMKERLGAVAHTVGGNLNTLGWVDLLRSGVRDQTSQHIVKPISTKKYKN